MVPKRPDETVEPFEHVDDFEFAVLRRQLARLAADNAATLKHDAADVSAGHEQSRRRQLETAAGDRRTGGRAVAAAGS